MNRKRSSPNTGPRPAHAFRQPRKLKLEDMKEQLTQAASNAFAAGHPTEYEQVSVVLLHFDNDDMGVDHREDELAATFEKEFGFDVEKVLLPGKVTPGAPRPSQVVFDIIDRLEDKGALGERCLVIIVFSGHGEVTHGELMVGGAVKDEQLSGKAMNWKGSWSDVFMSPCSVLQILDCCHAAEGTHPSVEMLASTYATERTSSDMAARLTQAVTRQLQAMDAGISFSVSEFTAAMMKPDYLPSYASRHNKHSIVLNKKANLPHEAGVFGNMDTNNARVLITVHVEEALTHGDLEHLKHSLLTAIPHAIEDFEIRLEGWHASDDSELLTYNLPAAVWLQLPEDEAWNFVAHIVSS